MEARGHLQHCSSETGTITGLGLTYQAGLTDQELKGLPPRAETTEVLHRHACPGPAYKASTVPTELCLQPVCLLR